MTVFPRPNGGPVKVSRAGGDGVRCGGLTGTAQAGDRVKSVEDLKDVRVCLRLR
jgi:hypothetical protein